MTTRQYTIEYTATDELGKPAIYTSFATEQGIADHSDLLENEYRNVYGQDPNFSIVRIIPKSLGDIDFGLSKRMEAVRGMCELGHRIRGDVKIRNRQPLSKAFIFFADKNVHEHMLYLDSDDGLMSILADELNVDDIQFISGTGRFTNINLKVSFRSLGKKGFGKQANDVKSLFANMGAEEKTSLYERLVAKESVNVAGVDLTLEDVEVSYEPKEGFASANNKLGVVVLDTVLTPALLERGYVADIKSALQNVRKSAELELTDRVFLEVFTTDEHKVMLTKHMELLKKSLLATGIEFPSAENLDKGVAHRFEVDGREYWVNLYKVRP